MLLQAKRSLGCVRERERDYNHAENTACCICSCIASVPLHLCQMVHATAVTERSKCYLMPESAVPRYLDGRRSLMGATESSGWTPLHAISMAASQLDATQTATDCAGPRAEQCTGALQACTAWLAVIVCHIVHVIPVYAADWQTGSSWEPC